MDIGVVMAVWAGMGIYLSIRSVLAYIFLCGCAAEVAARNNRDLNALRRRLSVAKMPIELEAMYMAVEVFKAEMLGRYERLPDFRKVAFCFWKPLNKKAWGIDKLLEG